MLPAAKDQPGPTNESPRVSEPRRTEIVRAGLDLFAISGFHGTSVRQIARAVGVNEATLYHYFPSKDAILTAVFDQVLDERRSAFTAWQDCEDEGLEAILRQVGQVFLQHAITPMERKLTRLMMSEGPRLSEEGRQAFERMHKASMQPARDLFGSLMASGRIRRLDPDLVVKTFFAPLILWKICHAMGQHSDDAAEAEALLGHQIDMLARSLQA